jgi:hypothetical protein
MWPSKQWHWLCCASLGYNGIAAKGISFAHEQIAWTVVVDGRSMEHLKSM